MTAFNGFKAKCRGFSHEESNTVCQDATEYFCDENIAVCTISDGHGSEKYFRSDVGSEKAVDVSVEAVRTFIARQIALNREDETQNNGQELTANSYPKLLSDLAGHIVSRWVDEVQAHWDEVSCNEDEKTLFDKHFPNAAKDEIKAYVTKIYGATLIIGVMTEHFGFVMQIGDGAACVIKKEGSKIFANTIDENQYLGQTNSLSSSNCLPRFRFDYFESIPKAIVVASDGVADSYAGNDGKDFLSFCEKLVNLYSGNYEQAQGFVEDWLPQLSKEGSQDDMSIAGVFLMPDELEPNIDDEMNEDASKEVTVSESEETAVPKAREIADEMNADASKEIDISEEEEVVDEKRD